jgi:nucleotide-binding universal stress UspA family protein
MKEREERGAFSTVLFCTDFSENADFAFSYALEQVRAGGGHTLHLLHVIPEPEAQFWKTYLYEVDDVDSKARRDIDEKIDGAYRSRLPGGITLETAFRVGTDHEEILSHAVEINADLIIIGRQGRSSLGKVLFGNVTEKVVRRSPCAVMVVPLSYEERAHGK